MVRAQSKSPLNKDYSVGSYAVDMYVVVTYY